MFRRCRTPRLTPRGLAFLNLGCGSIAHPDWNNLDLYAGDHVLWHDLRNPLPFAAGTFDAVYSSHVLEHFSPDAGERLLTECRRVLKDGGILRLAVPDLERLCAEYLRQIQSVANEPSPRSWQRYQWVHACLIDQMVREKPGGRMLTALETGDFDPDFLEQFSGEEVFPYLPGKALPAPVGNGSANPLRTLWRGVQRGPWGWLQAARRRWRRLVGQTDDPRRTGEAHKWMYDRVSLHRLLEELGFDRYQVCRFDESSIVDWADYQLDRAHSANVARKPDSLFVEARKRCAQLAKPLAA